MKFKAIVISTIFISLSGCIVVPERPVYVARPAAVVVAPAYVAPSTVIIKRPAPRAVVVY